AILAALPGTTASPPSPIPVVLESRRPASPRKLMKHLLSLVVVLALAGCHKDDNQAPQEAARDESGSAWQALQPELRYAPPETSAILSLNFPELLESKFVANLNAEERQTFTSSLTSDCGIPVADITRVTICGNDK